MLTDREVSQKLGISLSAGESLSLQKRNFTYCESECFPSNPDR